MELWHNPRCSISRKGKELLIKRGVSIKQYMKNPPTRDELWELLDKLGIEPSELIRKNEQLYKDLIKEHPQATRAKLVKWMAKHPRLIQRPILVHGDKAIIGRPPEKLLELF
jgi:arsenate reductase